MKSRFSTNDFNAFTMSWKSCELLLYSKYCALLETSLRGTGSSRVHIHAHFSLWGCDDTPMLKYHREELSGVIGVMEVYNNL